MKEKMGEKLKEMISEKITYEKNPKDGVKIKKQSWLKDKIKQVKKNASEHLDKVMRPNMVAEEKFMEEIRSGERNKDGTPAFRKK